MESTRQDDLERARTEGAAAEREAILTILERYSRRFLYGHGETGAHVLQQLADEIRLRSAADRPTPGSDA